MKKIQRTLQFQKNQGDGALHGSSGSAGERSLSRRTQRDRRIDDVGGVHTWIFGLEKVRRRRTETESASR